LYVDPRHVPDSFVGERAQRIGYVFLKRRPFGRVRLERDRSPTDLQIRAERRAKLRANVYDNPAFARPGSEVVKDQFRFVVLQGLRHVTISDA